MEISRIIKEKQPGEYSKLKQHSKHTEEKLTKRDIKELMSHSSYKRQSGAIRQVR